MVNGSPRMKEFEVTNMGGVVMSSFYRIAPRGASAQPGSGQRSAASSRQRQKPELEARLARLRSVQTRLSDQCGEAWADPVGSPVGDDVWPVMDELLHDWVYEA